MKKVFIAFLVLAMTISLIGCGTKPANETQNGGNPNSAAAGSDSTPNGGASDQVGFSKDGESVVFKVSSKIKLNENSWLGIVPAGTEYKNEVDADEVDVFWAYPENFNKKADEDYIFRVDAVSIENIEDGNYSMVLCDNDDEGVVILQFPIVIKGANITADFSKLKFN